MRWQRVYPDGYPFYMQDAYWLDQHLPGFWLLLYCPYYFHTGNDPAEGCKPLAIGVARAPKVEFGLRPDADEEF